jgi:uncharacterized protein (DUF433 family)
MATQFKRNMPEPATVTCTPGVMGGMPCLSGTRVPAETIRQYLVKNYSEFEIFDDYPYLPFGTVKAVIEWSKINGLKCSSS